jgi:hypothetical protein
MDTLKKLLEFLPFIQQAPLWLRAVFLAWVGLTAVLVFGLVVVGLGRDSSDTGFAVKLTSGQYITERQLALQGSGLARSVEADFGVFRVDDGVRVEVKQDAGTLTRRSNGDWLYRWITFQQGGSHELIVTLRKDGRSIGFTDPIRFQVGNWITAPPQPEHAAVTSGPQNEPADHNAVDMTAFVTIHDQGAEGTSPAFAVITAMEAALASQKTPALLSTRYLYEKAKLHDELDRQSEGTWMSAVLYVAQQFGVPLESVWPYSAGNRKLPKGTTWAVLDQSSPRFRVRSYQLSSFEEIATQLRQGRPVVAGIRVYKSTLITGQFGTLPGKSEVPLGLHAVAIIGWNRSDGSLTFANSWGTNWGNVGFGHMSVEVAKALLITDQLWGIEVVK